MNYYFGQILRDKYISFLQKLAQYCLKDSCKLIHPLGYKNHDLFLQAYDAGDCLCMECLCLE